MLTNRISFFSLLLTISGFVFITPTFTYSDDIWNVPLFSQQVSQHTQHAHDWSTWCVQEMTPQELQLTANLLYLLYVNALLDTEIQRCFSPLLELNQIVRNNLADPLNQNEELVHLKNLIDRIKSITSLRSLYTQMLNIYLNNYNQSKSNAIDQAMQTLQLYASESLHSWAQQQQAITAMLLEKSSRTMIESAQSIYSSANLYTGLHHNDLPFLVEEKDKPVAIFNTILQSEPHIMRALDKAANAVNAITDHAMNIICFGTKVYKEHYEALREAMISNDAAYIAILCDACGISTSIPEMPLPDTNHIIDHVFEIAQLVSQVHSEQITQD